MGDEELEDQYHHHPPGYDPRGPDFVSNEEHKQELRRRRAVRDDVCPVCGAVHEPQANELDASTA